MNKSLSSLIKNTGILAISNFASKIMIFFMVPIYTSILTTSEYGFFDLVISSIRCLIPILTLNICDAVMRFGMDNENDISDVLAVGFKYVFISYFSFFIILVSSFLFGDNYIKENLVYIALYFIFYILYEFTSQVAKALEEVSIMGKGGVISAFISFTSTILFLKFFKMQLKGFFLANILGQAIPAIYICYKLKIWKYIKKHKINKILEKEMLRYCIPLIFTALSWWVNSSFDKYIVTFMCGVSSNGLLSIAYKIPSILNIIQSIFIQAWQITAIIEYGKDGTNIFYGKIFIYINFVMTLASTGMIMLIKPIAFIMFKDDFYMAWKFVPFLLMSCVLNCASGFLGPILSAAKDSKSMANSAIYGVILNILMNIVLIYYIGIQGATIATLISSFAIYYFRKKAVGDSIKIEKYWKVILSWIIILFQSFAQIYFSNYIVQIVFVLMFLVINYEYIIEICKFIFKKKRSL